MFHRATWFALVVLTSLVIVSEQSLFAQRCIGTTAYLVHNATGEIMTLEEMKKTIVKVDGITLPEKELNNPLVFSISSRCGQIGELEIASRGKRIVSGHLKAYKNDQVPVD